MESALRVSIEGEKAKQQLLGLTRGLNKMEAAGNRAAASVGGTSRQIGAGAGAVNQMTVALKSMLAPLAAIYAIRGTLQILKDAQAANALLKQAAAQTVGYANAQLYAQQVATRYSIGINAARDSLARMLVIQQQGVLTTDQTIRIYEGLFDAQKALGVSQEAASRAMIQFSQAMGAGILRAEEYNSIVEAFPGLAVELDKASGLAAGGFRKMMLEGEVTAQMLGEVLPRAFEAFAGAAEARSGSFESMITRMSNAWALLIELLETPVSNMLTPVIDGITAGLTAVRSLIQSESMSAAFDVVAASWGESISWVLIAFDMVMVEISSLVQTGVQAIGLNWATLADTVANVFYLFPDYAAATMTTIIGHIDRALVSIKTLWANATVAFSAAFDLIPEYANLAGLGIQHFFLQAFDAVVSGLSSMMGEVAKGLLGLAQEVAAADFVPEGIKQGMLGMARSIASGAIALDEFGNSAAAVKDRMGDVQGKIWEIEDAMTAQVQANNAAAQSYKDASMGAVDAAWQEVEARNGQLQAALQQVDVNEQVNSSIVDTVKQMKAHAEEQKAVADASNESAAAAVKHAKAQTQVGKAASATSKALKGNANAINEYIESLQLENELLTLSDSERAVRNALLQAESIALKNNVTLTAEQAAQIEQLAFAQHELKSSTEERQPRMTS